MKSIIETKEDETRIRDLLALLSRAELTDILVKFIGLTVETPTTMFRTYNDALAHFQKVISESANNYGKR